MPNPPVTNGHGPAAKAVFFFDIDNCLYSRSAGVHILMGSLIDDYFAHTLSLSRQDAVKLHREYSTNYGLSIMGLTRHHQIDPLHYNTMVDDALPLETVLGPDPGLITLLGDLDRTKVTPWLLTNAYVNHARRVVQLLGVDHLFDGLTFCDYSRQPLVCKPSREMFQRAMEEAGVDDASRCFFVDDSYQNCAKSRELGWTAVHFVEEDMPVPPIPASQYEIRNLQELRHIFPHFFVPASTTTKQAGRQAGVQARGRSEEHGEGQSEGQTEGQSQG